MRTGIMHLVLIVLLVTASSSGPRTSHAQDVLDAYVAEGLQSNLSLQQQRIDLDRSLEALAEARGRFFPALHFEARVSVARGGRTIDLPIGDLVNPAYETLNQLLEAQGRPDAFPVVENREVRFLREREQDTRLRLTQPVYQPAIRANYRLNRSLVTSQEAALAAFQSTLVRDIRTAYYAYLKAERVVAIFDATSVLVAENLRTNERLYRNDRVTRDAVLRAGTEVLAVSQQQADAEKNRDLARSYFNFLLNRPLDAPIERVALDDAAARASALVTARASAGSEDIDDELAILQATALDRRHELDQLDAAVAASRAGVRLARSAFLPTAAVAVDAGIQGTSYGFGGDAPFVMASFVVQWNLFNGSQNRARLNKARLDLQQMHTRRDEVEAQIRLEVQEAYDAVQVALRTLATAEERVRAAREGFRLVERRYKEGLINQVEFLDARTALTNAELNLSVTQADLLIRLAELEYSAALGDTLRTASRAGTTD